MRLKASLSIPGADRFQLRKYCPERWLPSQETEERTKSVCQDVRCYGYNPNMASPIEENAVEHTMMLCPSSDHNADTEDEDDSSADSDFSETSPLLADFEEESVDEEEDEEDGIDACNNNNNNLPHSVRSSQDSLLSDAFNMSTLKDHHLAVENFRNNNNLSSLNGLFSRHELPGRVPLVEEDVSGSFFEEKVSSREIEIAAFTDGSLETVCPTSNSKTSMLPNRSSNTLTMAHHVQTHYLPDVLPLTLKHQDVTLNGIDSNRLSQETSPMSDSSTSSDTDVNLATHSFNNFTLSASKHNDILYLVQEEKKPKEINILETEPKILNTTPSSLPRNMTKRYHLRNDYGWTAADRCNGGLRDSSSSSQLHSLIADGLILEKVGPNESWQHYHTLYSSDDATKQFPTAYSLVSCKDEAEDEPTRNNDELSNKNHDHFCIERDTSLPNLNPNDPRLSSPPRKKDVVSEDLSPPGISPMAKGKETVYEEKRDNIGNHIPCVMDVESPTDNLNPVSAVASEVPKTDENHNRSSASYKHGNDNEIGVLPPVVTIQECSVVAHASSCAETAPTKTKNKSVSPGKELLEDFDVYNIETTMPTIDWVAMEAHLTRAAAEDDWLRRNDREEIRKKLAMDSDTEDYYCGERVTRKPSLSTRLQSGMNLQICFMNETASDQESQNSDHDTDTGNSDLNRTTRRTPSPPGDRINNYFSRDVSTSPLVLHCEGGVSQATNSNNNNNNSDRLISTSEKNSLNSQNVSNGNSAPHKKQRPSFFFARQKSWRLRPKQKGPEDQEDKGTAAQGNGRLDPAEDFYTRHARLQAEARMALAQAKEMARMQMEVERQKSKKSPIADIVGLPFPDNRHGLSRQILTDMNVAQLQVIVNDLHTQIESLNEDLVKLLLTRDDLHMEQDSMLVDIEDLTRYFRAKDEAQQQPQSTGQCKSTSKK